MLSRSSPTDRDALTTKDAPAALRTPAPAAARQARPNDVPSEALSTQEKRGQLHISFAAASRGALRRRLCANARAGVAMCAVVCRARSRVGAPAVGRPSRRRARCCAQRPGRGAPGAGGGAEGREGAPLPKRLVRRAEQDIDQLDRWQREATEEHWSQGGLRRDIFAGDVRGACIKRAAPPQNGTTLAPSPPLTDRLPRMHGTWRLPGVPCSVGAALGARTRAGSALTRARPCCPGRHGALLDALLVRDRCVASIGARSQAQGHGGPAARQGGGQPAPPLHRALSVGRRRGSAGTARARVRAE